MACSLDDENEIPLKVIASFSASRFALPSIPLIVLHSLVMSVFWSMVSTKFITSSISAGTGSSWSRWRCCLPSETYGRNGATPIFRSFHRTASSTTGGWSRWNILMCFIYHSEHYGLFFRGYHIIFTGLLFFHFVYISIFFRKYTLHVGNVFNVI